MAKIGANGSTVSFGGTAVGKVQSISFTSNGAEIDATDLSSTLKEYEAGIEDVALTVEIKGNVTHTVGLTASSLAITWTGTSTSIQNTVGDSIITSVEKSGDVDSPLISTITFRPYNA